MTNVHSDENNVHSSIEDGSAHKNLHGDGSVKHNLTSFDIWALGITVVIGGEYFSWNLGLEAGFGSCCISFFLISTGYLCLILCTSEISSGLPFEGGSYGLSRCVLGNYMGFLLGCAESIEYIFYVSSAVVTLGSMMVTIQPVLEGYEPAVYAFYFIVFLLIHIFGDRHFWTFNMFLAVVSFLIVLLYCFGSLKYVNLSKYAYMPSTAEAPVDNPWFVGGGSMFMKSFPLSAWLYVGVETLKEACADVPQPKIQIPRGQIACMITLMICGLMVLFISSSLPPGIDVTAYELILFNKGFEYAYNLSDNSLYGLSILSLPATFATAFGFVMMYGKVMMSLAGSKLLPTFLSYRHPTTRAPYMALIAGSILSYIFSLVCYFVPSFYLSLFNICILSASFDYIWQLVGYILLRTKYSTIRCEYTSPFGIYGAVYGICVWLLLIVGIIGFQDDNLPIIIVCSIYGLLTIWYYSYAKQYQSYSEEEKKVFFTIHVINHNLANRKRKKRRMMRRATILMRNATELAFAYNTLNILGISPRDPNREAMDKLETGSNCSDVDSTASNTPITSPRLSSSSSPRSPTSSSSLSSPRDLPHTKWIEDSYRYILQFYTRHKVDIEPTTHILPSSSSAAATATATMDAVDELEKI